LMPPSQEPVAFKAVDKVALLPCGQAVRRLCRQFGSILSFRNQSWSCGSDRGLRDDWRHLQECRHNCLPNSTVEAAPTLHRYCRKRLPQVVTDENMLVITERKKETLNLGGEKVSPRLIEEVLINHHSRPPRLEAMVRGLAGPGA
jgi:hypothetical protein